MPADKDVNIWLKKEGLAWWVHVQNCRTGYSKATWVWGERRAEAWIRRNVEESYRYGNDSVVRLAAELQVTPQK